MVRAYMLIQTEVGKTGRVAREVAEIEGTGSAVPVAGPYDVIAIVEAASMDALGKMVLSRIQGVKGVTRTLTCTRDGGASGRIDVWAFEVIGPPPTCSLPSG